MLKAIKPEETPVAKPKIMISGGSGVGKTMFALNWPSPYYIDTEGGAVRPQYRKKLQEAGGVYMGKDQGSQDFQSVVNEFKALGTSQHGFKTVVLDSFSYLYMLTAAKAEEEGGSDFGRDKKEANKPSRQLLRWVDAIDMSVVLICHPKDKWSKEGNSKDRTYVGTTYDGWEKMEFVLDLWIEIIKKGKGRYFVVKKSRIDAFPEGELFPLDYKKFAELYGEEIINRQAEAIQLASAEQILKVTTLLDVVKVPVDQIGEWWTKANVNGWSEMDSKTIEKVIGFLEKKLKAVAA